MFPVDFTYARARDLDHALAVLAEGVDADVKILAGGQSLLPLMKLRLAAPATLLDVGAIDELRGVTIGVEQTTLGALTTYRDLQRDPRIAARYPAISDAVGVLADPQVRARGTIGGCVAHGDPAADLPAVLLALDASVTIRSQTATRTISLDRFLYGVYSTDLAADEIVTAITIPAAPPGQAYEKFEQPASHLPLAGVCTVATIADGRLESARIAVTGVGPRPFRARQAEQAAVGHPVSRSSGSSMNGHLNLNIGASLAEDGSAALADQHASASFRLELAEVMARRALDRAITRAVGPGLPTGREERHG
ncbi:MAG TPA: xanthine dehydrogenase family protein subunit M [Trebonia sp.]|nr:xanthine dehydrogenase family protein subunit M [Trebonia sp.]